MIDNLVRASIDGAVMIGGIWLVSVALPRLSPSAKAMLWWCAAAKFVVTLLWPGPVILPVLPERLPVAQIAQQPSNVRVEAARDTDSIAITASVPDVPAVDWTQVAPALWAVGVLLSAGFGIHRWRRIRNAVSRSVACDAAVTRIAADIAVTLALRRVPQVRMSDDIDSPLVTGLLRPVVLLPASRFPHMPVDQQRMAICHELAHVRRGDVWLGCVPAVAERIFFFHPLVRLGAREYIFWREAACDAAVLRALGAAPQAYGRLLLNLGVTRPQPALAAAGAAWSFSTLKRRIVMLQQPSTPGLGARLVAASVIAITAVAVVPLRLGAREAVLPPVAPRPVSPPISAITTPTIEGVTIPAPPQSEQRVTRPRGDLRFVFMSDETTTMSGQSRDVERARSLRNRGEDLLWFFLDGKEYVVRDRGVLEQVQDLWGPVQRIGAEQGAIGAKQGEIGAQQGAVGARQGSIGAEQGAIGARQGEIGARQAQLASREARQLSERERRDIENERRELDRQMRELDREMAALSDKMQDASKPMTKLGEEMRELGEEMSVLGRKMQEASAKAESEMRNLLERAISRGVAQQVR